jgi:hypothetical protein
MRILFCILSMLFVFLSGCVWDIIVQKNGHVTIVECDKSENNKES